MINCRLWSFQISSDGGAPKAWSISRTVFLAPLDLAHLAWATVFLLEAFFFMREEYILLNVTSKWL